MRKKKKLQTDAVDGEQKEMKTIIFITTSPEDQVKSCETLNNACIADERCKHKIFFRPIMQNMFQWISGHRLDKDAGGNVVLGNHEILYIPAHRELEITRLEQTKNVVLKINCMCFVGDNDQKKLKVKKIIDWLLEETEEIRL